LTGGRGLGKGLTNRRALANRAAHGTGQWLLLTHHFSGIFPIRIRFIAFTGGWDLDWGQLTYQTTD